MSAGASIELRDVRVRYGEGEREAVAGVSFDVEPGRFVALLGPSGCGKTTLLRTINRLVPVASGCIRIDGADIEGLDPVEVRRKIGYAIQAVGLFSHMSVAQNVGIVPELLGWPRAEIDARVDEMLALVRLEPVRYRSRRPRELSGGEAQRVGVARAFAGRPRALLMDEPFGALDAIVRRQLQHELLEIVRKLDTTTIFVTHDIEEALILADRIVIMREGAIEQAGTAMEILGRPATPFVQELFASDASVSELRERARLQYS
ncbi:MAG: ATP-binding cassette domain-containing protein [Candidatus Eremiobacteraeota bacterium]|nr:ATP-binding cassette domain-containing protein [Candidatus Eremiobacteraeota bacterium]